MNLDGFLKGFDQTKIKVIAGDIPQGMWELDGTNLRQAGSLSGDSIDLSTSVKKMTLKDLVKKDQFEPLIGAGVGALMGLRFGLIGAAGGAFLGHMLLKGNPEVSINCELNDGRTFIAVMSAEMHERLQMVVPVTARKK